LSAESSDAPAVPRTRARKGRAARGYPPAPAAEPSVEPFDAPPTLTSAVVKHIQDLILRGDFPPGSALPEIPLAQRLETSRGTVREALRALADLGLVELHARRGAIVPQLSPQRAREIFSLRALLEPFAAKLALTEGHIREPELRRINDAFEWMRKCGEDGRIAALVEADMAFHWAICSPCGHELLLEQLRSLQVRTRQFIFHTKFYDSDVESEVEAHAPLLRAIVSGEADRVEAAVRDHITKAGERLLVRMLEAHVGAGDRADGRET
jgi:DNA-binding GntR family transcriptional regulator